jgi:multidrug efflux pump subunit AcrA (membrane-fusion protein)
MSSTVNIITKTIKNIISIPIQSLTSRPENYNKIKKSTKSNKREWEKNDDENVNFKKAKPIDVVFVLQEEFEGEKAIEGKKYAIVKPIKPGISGENYYSIETGVKEGDIIVTGGYRLISKELSHGDLVSLKNDINEEAKNIEKK